MEQEISEISKFSEKRTTSGGCPQFSKRISKNVMFHLISGNFAPLVLVLTKRHVGSGNIVLVINKSDSRCYHLYNYRPNWTPLSPITITYLYFFCKGSRMLVPFIIKSKTLWVLRTSGMLCPSSRFASE